MRQNELSQDLLWSSHSGDRKYSGCLQDTLVLITKCEHMQSIMNGECPPVFPLMDLSLGVGCFHQDLICQPSLMRSTTPDVCTDTTICFKESIYSQTHPWTSLVQMLPKPFHHYSHNRRPRSFHTGTHTLLSGAPPSWPHTVLSTWGLCFQCKSASQKSSLGQAQGAGILFPLLCLRAEQSYSCPTIIPA